MEKIVGLANDANPAFFKLTLDISGLNVSSVGSVVALLRTGHVKSLAYLVREDFKMLGGCLTPGQLLFHSAVMEDWHDARELAKAVEAAAPGTARTALDPFGNNPVWYALYNWNEGDRKGMAKYAALLESLGCDPDRPCHLGLSARDVGITAT